MDFTGCKKEVEAMVSKQKEDMAILQHAQQAELFAMLRDRLEQGMDGVRKDYILYDHYQCICVVEAGLGYYKGFRLNKSTRKPFKNTALGVMYMQNIKKVVKT